MHDYVSFNEIYEIFKQRKSLTIHFQVNITKQGLIQYVAKQV